MGGSSMTFVKVCAFVGVLMTCASAQTDRGTITGTVTDQGGAVIASATVVAKASETGLAYQSITTETGNYTITQLPYGSYEVTVEITGFKKYVHTNILVEVAQTLREDISMQLGSSSES